MTDTIVDQSENTCNGCSFASRWYWTFFKWIHLPNNDLVISITEKELDPSFGEEYAVWFYLDKEQSSFVELSANRPSRQPELFIREGHHVLQVELFAHRSNSETSPDAWYLLGESQIPASFLRSTEETYLIVEIKQSSNNGDGRGGGFVANMLLMIEKYDHRGRSLSTKSSPAPSISRATSNSADEVILDSPLSINDYAPGIPPPVSSALLEPMAQRKSPHALDFLQKFTLAESPIIVYKSVSASPLESLPPLEDDLVELDQKQPPPASPIPLSLDSNNSNIPSPSKSPGNLLRGLVSLEVIAAQNLPREKRLLRVHYQNNPFAVISFGRTSFRTKVIKRTVNPVWKEKMFFTVREQQASYHVHFSIYDYDKFSYNSCIGSTTAQLGWLLDHPNCVQKFALPLKLVNPTEHDDACIIIKACFISYDVLRKNFWETLSRQYDHDDNGKLNKVELTTMLETIGSTLSDETIEGILQKLDIDIEGEVEIRNIVSSLEDLTVKSQKEGEHEENIVLIEKCPICNNRFNKGHKNDDIDVITHLGICAAKDAGSLERFIMGGFLTEDYASRKWFMKILSFMSFGGYRLGRNNGNILVQDRRTGKLLEERMPTYIRLGIRWMHQYSAASKAVDSRMVRQIFQSLTLKQGRRFDDPASVRNIPDFIKYHKLNIDEILDPLDSFKTFNEFFYRKLKPSARKLASPDPKVCVSPADCRMNCFATVSDATNLWIKGANFTIASLLKDDQLATYFEGGSVSVCRLAPQDYHRFHSPVDGKLIMTYHIPGTYFTVNPMAVRQKIDIFTENARTVYLIDSIHFGKVAFVAVGAMMVGSIVVTADEGSPIERMTELGYFAFGGSTIVMLFSPGKINFDADLTLHSQDQLETLVQVGNSIGISTSSL